MLTNLLNALQAIGVGFGMIASSVLVVIILLAADNYSF